MPDLLERAVAAEEPTQAAIRARLRELTDGALPSPEAPVRSGEVSGRSRAVSGIGEARREGSGIGGARTLAVAYLLPGLPPEGSGGSHSLVQEARGLRALGASAWICVPADSLASATRLYGNDDGLFTSYAHADGPAGTVAKADVVVATEYPSVDVLARLRRERPERLCAYYVQDYEPLFAAPESSRADRALLSYRAIPDLLLFAKTHWLGDLVGLVHGVAVAKVAPSLDRELFHAGGRSEPGGHVRVAAMIRPRTPRRRPVATLRALATIAGELGEGVRIFTFGCDEDSFAQLQEPAVPGLAHLGLLSRMQVAELMRRCDVFIDASAYQAFGRTGLEAMACGAVPILPELGGVHEYATHGEDAVILAEDEPREIAASVIDLARDPARLRRLSEAGMTAARSFSVERAARSQLELFAGVAP